MVGEVEREPTLTLSQMRDAVLSKFSMDVSTTSISRILQGALITVKQLRFVPNTANNETNKQRRKIFVEKLLDLRSNECPIVYLDETNFNLFISRSVGRSAAGTRANKVRPTSKGKNIHLIGSIGTNGFKHYEIRRGSFTSQLANEYLHRCLLSANDYYAGRPFAIVIDNAPCHSRAEEVFNDPQFDHVTLLRLAPYSPMLNPIENAWSEVKSIAKRELSGQLQEILAFTSDTGESATEFRLMRLERIIEYSMNLISISNINSYLAGVQRNYSAAINLQDMIF